MPVYKQTELECTEVRTPAFDVPLIIDDWSLAFRLGFTGKTLWYIVDHRKDLYQEFMIKKNTGGMRRTFNPNTLMRVFQHQLRYHILLPLCNKLGDHVSAYRTGKSTLDAANMHLRECKICDETTKPHTNPVKHACPRRGVKFKLDLKDFFLSTRRSFIRRYFHEVVGYNHYASSLLGQLLTTDYQDERRRNRTGVPPGALTAGDICNLVADWLIDQHILRELPEWRYTRYADDLYFSSEKVLPERAVKNAIGKVKSIIRAGGYEVNNKKTRIQYWQDPQRMLGVNINRKLNMPAEDYNNLHRLLYFSNKLGFDAVLPRTKKSSVHELHSYFNGVLNYYDRFAPHKVQKLRRLYDGAKQKHGDGDVTSFEFVKGEIKEARL